jgi:hypothetical protein
MGLMALATMSVLAGPAWASDPDMERAAPEGQVLFTGERLEVGATARAFLVQYEGHPWKVSPSRYAVDFDTATFRFRNAEAHAVTAPGQWYEIVFSVNTVSETAVEDPAGSNNWSWKLTYEAALVSLTPTD